MLNIFYGRESIDKEKFIYERIAEDHSAGRRQRTLVIVPDQYTLEAEKQAFSASSYKEYDGYGNYRYGETGKLSY